MAIHVGNFNQKVPMHFLRDIIQSTGTGSMTLSFPPSSAFKSFYKNCKSIPIMI